MKKGQAVMEWLMTYGWAILVVLVAIGALVYFEVIPLDGRSKYCQEQGYKNNYFENSNAAYDNDFYCYNNSITPNNHEGVKNTTRKFVMDRTYQEWKNDR